MPPDPLAKAVSEVGIATAFPVALEPSRPGIYFLVLAGRVVYVGQAVDIGQRIKSHYSTREKQFDSAYFVPCDYERLSLLEMQFIHLLQPQYNSAASRSQAADWERAARNAPAIPDTLVRRMVDTAVGFLRETDEDGIPAGALYDRVIARLGFHINRETFVRQMDRDHRVRWHLADAVYRPVAAGQMGV